MARRLYISHAPEFERMSAASGRVDDGVFEENWRRIGDQFAFLHDGPRRDPR